MEKLIRDTISVMLWDGTEVNIKEDLSESDQHLVSSTIDMYSMDTFAIPFVDEGHKKRWIEAADLTSSIEEDGTVRNEFAATLFILTADKFTYDIMVKDRLSLRSIDFPKILKNDFSSGEQVLMDMAAEMFNWYAFKSPSTSNIACKLDRKNLKLALSALYMRGKKMNISGICKE